MTVQATYAERTYLCETCPLMVRKIFRNLSEEELAFMSRFKRGELTIDRGATVLAEGTKNPHLYTVLFGWGFRYKLLPDGRRQIVNYVMPGDLIGLQGSLMGEMQHSVEALSPMVLCMFERSKMLTLFHDHPELAYDVTWIASREECMLDENLLSVGRRTALERLAYLIAFVFERATDVGLMKEKASVIPITQQHVADTLGLSLVHTNKTIRKLANLGLISWSEKGCKVLDPEKLQELAHWEADSDKVRPFI
ncbi:Crp/Fnr family transcriptional regulator [Aquamicrobium sp. LC103]|uniref:Crp/Fnr family transcriptional regulator n=1 Tax=Aquamicrobium sp. LC103 TaxID=1120658 RepID=UPI00063E928A|nr:Crp/Fnr family transcriptional regulator [Aquamicrobium sp. LC103]TKT75308.1 Crp/Fnr family transcriptional regulator [Aquamicrobium sp. LC103]